jgi:hypothetical protein
MVPTPHARLRLSRGNWGGVTSIGCRHVGTGVRPLTGTPRIGVMMAIGIEGSVLNATRAFMADSMESMDVGSR